MHPPDLRHLKIDEGEVVEVPREFTEQITENLGSQHRSVPTTHQSRVLIVGPRMDTILDAILELKRAGVPHHAKLDFHKWNAPDTNYYVIATWE